MSGRSKQLRLGSKVATTLAIIGAQPGCGLITSDSTSTPPDQGTGGSGREPANPSQAGAGGALSIDVSCPVEGEALAAQAVPFPSGRPRIFYSWTTAEQAAELRAGETLFSRSEREGMGRGYAFTALAEFATTHADIDSDYYAPRAELARIIGEDLFVTARYAWTNTWATRLGTPDEDYGDQLLRIELDPEAWIVQFDGSMLEVYDQNDVPVPIEEALAHPERIGAVYFMRSEYAGGPYCDTFGGGYGGEGAGYREFVLGNLAMVREWSLGTDAIRAAIEDDVALLEELRSLLVDCPPAEYYAGWEGDVVCGWWGYSYSPRDTSPRFYEDALSLPSELYYPTPDRLQGVIDALVDALFEPDPLIVEPNESP